LSGLSLWPAEAEILCEILQSGPNNMTQFNWGVNYRALHDLFHMTQSRLDVFHYEIGVQMLEIYNEQVRDLLNTDGVHRKYTFHTSVSHLFCSKGAGQYKMLSVCCEFRIEQYHR
jgi:hypothetical protein